MKNEIIETALKSALRLLYSELESVCIDELKVEYLQVISQIEDALSEIEKLVNGKA